MTTAQYELKADKREILGKKVKQLRRNGQIPANIFGEVKESVAITIPEKEFRKIYSEAGETGLVYVQLGEEKKTRPTLVDEVEYSPMGGKILHVSFRQVDLKQKISAPVPVELVGELSVDGAVTNLMIQEIEVEALPTDLPEAFEIDLAQFTEIGQEFTVANLNHDASKIEISLEPDTVLFQVQEFVEMAEEETPTPETVVGDGETAEGETATPSEGGEAAPADAGSAEEKSE